MVDPTPRCASGIRATWPCMMLSRAVRAAWSMVFCWMSLA